MGQCRRGYDVAYGIDALDRRAVELVNHDLVALDLDAGLLKAYVFDIGLDTYGRQHDGGRQRLVALLAFDLHVAAAVCDGDVLYGCRGHHVDAHLAETALHGFGDLLVLERHELRHVLDDRDLYPQ